MSGNSSLSLPMVLVNTKLFYLAEQRHRKEKRKFMGFH
uniref:Uncharacterized protein n=1 Tax=Anguilla anguilla TaxID=7936 RepID=A0A0E9QW25_ANGAN